MMKPFMQLKYKNMYLKILYKSSKLKQEIEILRELHHPNIIFLH